ncbi:ABC transporter substrate-binding protein [Nesterenkonia ebinurensis]|uniref:ABC transporter substrate-binding protein n=1 Tax=Nesterenkonia ebinurensis TaxID=2608252 RepID=UPI00168B459D|nr:ABC transporter substrate-binding protein [Nesterenkonia ebinurensis]
MTLDPAFSSAISSDRNVLNMFYDTLVRQDADGEFVPALAEDWEQDGDTLRFFLREGVTFHDGTDFDAEAAVANLTRVMDPENGNTKAAALAKVEEVTAEGEHILELTLSEPDPILLVNLAHEAGMMASPSSLEADSLDREPVGTGPFTLSSWRSNVNLVAEANPDYWRTDDEGEALPRLGQVTFDFVTDPSTLRANLSAGQVDMVRVLPPEEYLQLEENPQVTFEDTGVRRSYYISINQEEGVFENPQAREALSLAVDREGIGEAAASGEYDISPSFATEFDWFFDESIQVPEHDPERAAELIEEAGLEGEEVSILVRRRDPDPTIAELVQSELNQTGLSASVEVLEFESLLDQMNEGDYDAAVMVIDVPRLDPSLTFDPYLVTGAPNNWGGISSDELDDLLAEGTRIEGESERAEIYSEVQRSIGDNNDLVFLHQPTAPLIHDVDLQGLVFNVDGQWRLDEAWFES